ncbi:MAG: flavin reductase family protein [Fusobacteria bacterium]|nr:flavin reductase family protein [Fusobacteriota bacterium]
MIIINNKVDFKPGNFLYPAPAVMVSCGDNIDNLNIITISWTGNICTNPAMVYVSIRPERYSYNIIERTREFVINLTNEDLTFACDFCGVKSGRDVDKFNYLKLTKEKAKKINSYIIKESPVNIECKVKDIINIGTHSMFVADVVNIQVNESLLDSTGKFHFNNSNPIVYSHGEYRGIKSETIGTFGYSIKKKK